MPSITVINNITDVSHLTDAVSCKSLGSLVDAKGSALKADHKGNQYRIVAKKERSTTFFEKMLIALALLSSLGLALIHKSFRKLVGRQKVVNHYAIQEVSNKPDNTGKLRGDLPQEVLYKIFGYFDRPNLQACSRVCKDWHDTAYDATLLQDLGVAPKNLYESKKWNEDFGLEVDATPRLTNELIRELNKVCPFSGDGRKVYETHTICLVPKTNGQSLPFYEAQKLARSKSLPFLRANPKNPAGTCNSQWILMYNGIAPVSLGKSDPLKVELIFNDKTLTDLGYEVPDVIEVYLASLAGYAKSGTYPFEKGAIACCSDGVISYAESIHDPITDQFRPAVKRF